MTRVVLPMPSRAISVCELRGRGQKRRWPVGHADRVVVEPHRARDVAVAIAARPQVDDADVRRR